LRSIFGDKIDREVATATDDLWGKIAVYPGYRKVNRVKEEWLRLQRPEDWKSVWDQTSLRPVGMEWTEWLQEMGLEVMGYSEGEEWFEEGDENANFDSRSSMIELGS
jgi:hypothetical protein